MAESFEIEAEETSFTFNGEREANATFVVDNVSGLAVRARAQLVPQEQAQRDWYRIEGSAERLLDTEQEQTFAVHIGLPADAPPGAYGFRFDVVDVANPDENFELGPDVIIRIPEPPPPPVEEKKPFPWKIAVAIGAGVLVLLGILAFILTRGGAEADVVIVPDVGGLTVTSAVDRLEGTLEGTCEAPPCLTVATDVVYQAQSEFTGRVTDQDPDAGTELIAGDAVNITVLGVESSDFLDRMIDAELVDQIFVEAGAFDEIPKETILVICKYDPSIGQC